MTFESLKYTELKIKQSYDLKYVLEGQSTILKTTGLRVHVIQRLLPDADSCALQIDTSGDFPTEKIVRLVRHLHVAAFISW